MEKRVEKIESVMSEIQVRLIRVEAKLDASAMKSDLSELAAAFHKSMNEQTWKFLAGATGMAALFSATAFGLARALGQSSWLNLAFRSALPNAVLFTQPTPKPSSQS